MLSLLVPMAGAEVVGGYHYDYDEKTWPADPLQQLPKVQGHNADGTGRVEAKPQAGARELTARKPSPAQWPAEATATVNLGGTAAKSGSAPAGKPASGQAPVRAGATPVLVGTAAPEQLGAQARDIVGSEAPVSAPSSVEVKVADRAKAQSAGVDGLLVGLSRADSRTEAGSVAVSLDYGAIAQAYGGGWASRLRLVAMPSCALTTPQVEACRQQVPVEYQNDPVGRKLTGTVAIPAGGGSGGAAAGAKAFAAPASGVQAASSLALAAVADVGGSQGSYGATSLSASGSWSQTASGAFTYSYPVPLPPSLAGSVPSVALSYNSQAIDGETSARNSQASWIGDGWSYSPGFIERSYKGCGNAGIDGSADQCWAGWNATLSLGSHSGELIRDANGVYHLESDDGTRVERLTGAVNGLWEGEYFKVTTTDGTAYYLGLNHAPGTSSDNATNSAWAEPVYHPNSGDPCYTAAKGKASQCDKQPGYRFNIDFVVDPQGNLQRYDWANETNYYSMGYGQAAKSGGYGSLQPYTRAGHLTGISYGYQLSDATAGREPSSRVTFGTAERCVVSDDLCKASNLNTSTAGSWQDTPYDLNCQAGWPTSGTGPNVCKIASPTFWSTVRLNRITTEIRTAAGWKSVDQYDLKHLFSEAGATIDPVTGTEGDTRNAGSLQSVLWLSEISHTGLDTSAGDREQAVTLDPVSFKGIEVDNRVDGLTPAAPPLYRPRISGIQTDTGSFIAVSYRDQECSRNKGTMPASADTNTMACFPVYWTTPGGGEPIADWFHKTLVAKVTVSDLTKAASPAQSTSYTYGEEGLGAAWHRDDSELTDDRFRTWNDFRGYRTVTTTTGAAPDAITRSTSTYFRGMNGDYLANGTTRRQVSWKNSVDQDAVDDNPLLAGMAQETTTYTKSANGTAVAKAVPDVPTTVETASKARTAWASKKTTLPPDPPRTLSTLPPLTAQRVKTTGSRELSLLSDSQTWRTTRTSTDYDDLGRQSKVHDKGDVSVPAQETCTTVTYADPPTANPMMLIYPKESVSVAGPCGTAESADRTIGHKRYVYDGNGDVANPGAVGVLGQNGTSLGLLTATQSVKSYDGSGQPVFQTQGAQSHDQYGRVVRDVDAAGTVTTTAYTPAAGILATELSSTNALGWTGRSVIAPARGLVTRAVDVNGRITDSAYDALGRRTKVWTPGRNKDDGKSADRTFEYAVHGKGEKPDVSSITTRTLRENETYSTSVAIYDGMLQARQNQSTPANNSEGRLVSSVRYDSHGWPVITIPTWSDPTTAPGSTLFEETENTLPSEQVTVYDGLGRPTAQQLYAKASLLWQSTTAYPGADRVDSTPPNGGTATTTFTNALGQTTSSVVHGGPGIGDVTTSYSYKPGGEVSAISDTVGNTWSYGYDLRGNRISQTDPGSGTSTVAYDDLGRVATSTDGRGRSISFTYDLLGRVTGRYDGTSTADPAKLLASSTYDTLAKGYPTSTTRYDGGASGNQYVQKVNGYNTAYQPTGTTTTIPASEGRLAGDYTSSAAYTPNVGLLASIGYNADGGLPAESLGFGYNVQGKLLQSGTANTPLLDLASYNPRGQLLQSTYGKAGGLLRTKQTYDDATGRLTTNRVSLQTGDANPVSAKTYGYDEAGNLTNVAELQSSGSTDQAFDVQCYRYDGLNRLAEAWTDTWGVSKETAGQLSHCNNPNPGPSAIGGPAPYWQSWQHNLLGDRTQQVKHDITGDTSRDITQTITYPGGGRTPAAKPNSATTVTTSSGPATSTVTSAVPNGSTSNCLDVNGAWTADGTAVQVYTCNGSGAQKWTRGADGTLRALGKCAGPVGNWPGAAIELRTCDGGDLQQWQDGANGALLNTGANLCLDLPAWNATPGTQVALWYCNGQGNQQWPVSTNAPTGPSSNATLTPQYDQAGNTTSRAGTNSGTIASGLATGTTPLCLDVDHAWDADGTGIFSFTCNGGTGQQWTAGTDGTLRAVGKCLRPVGGSGGSNTQLELWTCDGSAGQEWRPGAGGTLVNPASGLCIDIPGATTEPVTRVILWTCAPGSPNQKWDSAEGTPAPGTTQSFTYNAEGLTETVTTPSGGVNRTATYLYDANGGLLIHRGPDSTVLYLFGGEEQLTLDRATDTVSGTRYYNNPDGTVIVRSSSGALTYQPTDLQGTSGLEIDGTTKAVTRRAFDPYGNPRGTVPQSWADNHGYLGKPADATSGLNLLGARNYDPALGRFLSVDPVLMAGDPNQMGGYAYGNNNPVNLSDPNGLWPSCGWCKKAGKFVAGAVDSAIGWAVENSPYVAMNNAANEMSKEAGVPLFGTTHYIEPTSHPVADIFGIAHDDPYYVAGEIVETVVEIAVDGVGLVKAGVKGVRLATKAIKDAGGIRKAAGKLLPKSSPKPSGPKGGSSGPSTPHQEPAAPKVHQADPKAPATPKTDPSPPHGTTCSFTPETPVLMADGSSKAIGDIKTGDLVQAADQETATEQGARAVTATLVHEDKELIDLTVRTESGAESTVHTTAEHPFWDDTTHTWVPAADLTEGHTLKTTTGTPVRITAVRPFSGAQQMYNLTVAQLHTYYVLAGTTPVLVHNECPDPHVWEPYREGVDHSYQADLPAGEGLAKGAPLTEGTYTFIVRRDGSLRALDDETLADFGAGHASLGDHQGVIMAGTFEVDVEGVISRIINFSGHYRPDKNMPGPTLLEISQRAFRRHGWDFSESVWEYYKGPTRRLF
ncbi:ricin-type beta-trefoil lectin domain protein [Kitasatospora sp. NPDC052868]|uniref:ricin-type beta-trefoil lectin domain protein n=1 Tax=Kitasatospora sp. NPDC052868 TaxID=3364060 RepID=UPI0037C59097